MTDLSAEKPDPEKQLLPRENKNSITLEDCNKNTLFFDDKENDRAIYVFNYHDFNINRFSLKKLRDANRWNVIKHPIVLNYVNEILLESAWMYTVHIVTYFFFLFMLYSYIHTKPNMVNNSIVTILVIFFILGVVSKAKLKTLRDNCQRISPLFTISYVLTFLCYIVVLFFVWTPYLFNFDDYDIETKRAISWMLPIVAIIMSWIQCLHVLRKAPCGPYIMMMTKILKSFLDTTIIWVPTLLCFAFCFQLVMRDSGTHPWDDPIIANSSASLLMSLFQSFTKTSAMMIGEVEANDILELRDWIPNLLLIVFEIITVILLMNLMISLAVGDVNELRASAEDRRLRVKTNYVIEVLHFSEFLCSCTLPLYKKKANNIVVVSRNPEDGIFSLTKPLTGRATFGARPVVDNKTYDLTLNAEDVQLETSNIDSTLDRLTVLGVKNAILRVVETNGSGIATVTKEEFRKELQGLRDTESCVRKYKRWLIGVNWRAFVPVR